MDRNIDRSAVTTDRASAFSQGSGKFSTPTHEDGPAGNASDENPGYPTTPGGTAMNAGRGRLAGATEKHYDGGQVAIRQGQGYGKGSTNINPR